MRNMETNYNCQKCGILHNVSVWHGYWYRDYFGRMERFAKIKDKIHAHANNVMNGMKERQTEFYER